MILSTYGLWLLLLCASEVTDPQELMAEPATLLCDPGTLWSRFEDAQQLPHLWDLPRLDREAVEQLRHTWCDFHVIASAGVRERLHRQEEYSELARLCLRQASLCYYLIDAMNPNTFVWSRRNSFATALNYGEMVLP